MFPPRNRNESVHSPLPSAGHQLRLHTQPKPAVSVNANTCNAPSNSYPVPGVFTRNNTIASSASSIGTSSSRISVGNEAEASQRSKPEQPTMKYLKIEFSDEIGKQPLKPNPLNPHTNEKSVECSRFKEIYNRLCHEETSRPADSFADWEMRDYHERPESAASTSTTGTPFNMSPDLRPMRNHAPSSLS